VKTNRRDSLSDKPVVIVRKKAGPKRSPTGPTTAAPSLSSPVQKAAARTNSSPSRKQKPPAPQPSPAASDVTASGPSKKEQERQARRELLEIFCDRWPRAFPRDYRQVKPLALGIRQDMAASLPEQPPGRIGFVIGTYQQLMRPAYFRAVLQGGPRYDLEGKPRGEVTPEEKEHAGRDLHAFYERRRKNAAPRAPAPKDTPSGLE
jgi:ProP effector